SPFAYTISKEFTPQNTYFFETFDASFLTYRCTSGRLRGRDPRASYRSEQHPGYGRARSKHRGHGHSGYSAARYGGESRRRVFVDSRSRCDLRRWLFRAKARRTKDRPHYLVPNRRRIIRVHAL